MTAPAFRSVASTASTGVDETITVTKPSGTVDNDILLAQVYTEPNGQTITPPAGWTAIATIDNTGGLRTGWYYKRAASEGADYTWTATGSTWLGAAIAAYSRCITSGSPIDVAGAGDTGSDTSPAAAAVTTTVADTLIVYGSQELNLTPAYTPPTGMAERLDTDVYYFADVAQAAAGSTGTKTATLSATAPWSAILIALKPPRQQTLTLIGLGA